MLNNTGGDPGKYLIRVAPRTPVGGRPRCCQPVASEALTPLIRSITSSRGFSPDSIAISAFCGFHSGKGTPFQVRPPSALIKGGENKGWIASKESLPADTVTCLILPSRAKSVPEKTTGTLRQESPPSTE